MTCFFIFLLCHFFCSSFPTLHEMIFMDMNEATDVSPYIYSAPAPETNVRKGSCSEEVNGK